MCAIYFPRVNVVETIGNFAIFGWSASLLSIQTLTPERIIFGLLGEEKKTLQMKCVQ